MDLHSDPHLVDHHLEIPLHSDRRHLKVDYRRVVDYSRVVDILNPVDLLHSFLKWT